MIEIKSPNTVNLSLSSKSIFLAGSIEEGRAEPWQEKITEALRNYDVTIFNPRRDNWDPSWKQSVNNPQFKEQVEWELNTINAVDIVLIYIDPNTKSPITLLEFGVLWKSGKVIICCPQGFWRRGNLEVMCAMQGIHLHETLDDLIETTKLQLTKY